MHKSLFSILITCAFLLAHSQSFNKDKYKNLASAFQQAINSAELQDSINILQATSPSYLTGLDLSLSSALPNKILESKSNRYQSTWKFTHPGIASRFLLHLHNIEASDSLLFFTKDGILSEIITGEIPEYFSSEALADQQYIQLRSQQSTQKFKFLKISAEPLPIDKDKSHDFGDSQPCQVNVNCFNNIDAIKKSVVRILVRKGNLLGFCSGTLMNNTNYDFTPYILTAEHCGIISGGFVDPQDLNGWVFYFNYESPNCENPPFEGLLANQKLSGADVMARSFDQGGETGSDFLLLKLYDNIPPSFDVYFAGWNRSAKEIPRESMSIHHPEGDIKKIAVSYIPPSKGSFGENLTYNTHWLVNWNSSPFGFGTTETGSSGAALLDQEQLVRGQLTGGLSSCSAPDGTDYFGMMSHNWNAGKPADNNLAHWLDPQETGYLAMNGLEFGNSPPLIAQIDLYPSPANDFIIIGNLSPYKELHLTISHISGKVVFDNYIVSTESKTEKIEIVNWASGVYIAYVYLDEIMHTYKFIVQ